MVSNQLLGEPEMPFTAILAIFAIIVAFGALAGLLYGLVRRSYKDRPPPTRTEAVVEVRSGTLVAFDFPSEAASYRIPDFLPGQYRIPRDAILRVASGDPHTDPGMTISVDTATIMLVDAEFEDKLRAIEDRLFEEINACPSVVYRYDAVVDELGIRFDYLDIDGDGAYVIDVSRIERINDSHAGT